MYLLVQLLHRSLVQILIAWDLLAHGQPHLRLHPREASAAAAFIAENWQVENGQLDSSEIPMVSYVTDPIAGSGEIVLAIEYQQGSYAPSSYPQTGALGGTHFWAQPSVFQKTTNGQLSLKMPF